MSDDDSSLSANENPAAVASRLPQGNYRFSASRAVIIGIDEYQSIRRLGTAVSDATRLAATLEDEHGYEDVQLLTDASRDELIAELSEKLPERASSNDRLLLYFAGHGIALDGKDGPEGYLIPADARPDDPSTYIAMADLHRWLEALPCRHLLVVLDCCFAGSFTWYGGRSVRPIGKKLYREHYDRFLREPAWQIITSAAHDQEALDVLSGGVLGVRGEHSADGERHSPFADAFFAALQGEGDLIPKGGGDGVVTATELYLYLRQSVEVGAEQYAKHRQTPELWPFSRTRHGKGEFIFLVPGQDEPELESAPTLTAQNNPYRGLESYDEAQTDLFFGRRGLVEELATKVDKHPFTVVVGASGTGKSSVVKAGLVPYLKQREESAPTEDGQAKEGHSPRYVALPPFRPGDAPLQSLADLVATSLLEAVDQSDRVEPAKYVVETVGRWLHSHPDLMLLLVVDQAEELVTLCRDDTVRADFLQVLADALEQYPGQLRVVFTLRTDFEPQFDVSPLSGFWKEGRLVTPPMSRTELREVIEEAAAARVLFFDPPELVDTLIDEVQQTPGALPLLSFTLEQLYLKYIERQNKALIDGITLERSLTLADYESLGGVIGSLRRRAEEVLSDLPDDEHRATMQCIMLRMVAVEGGELARRRVTRNELIYPADAENGRVQTVLARLESARLLITNRQDSDGDGSEDALVEPAHDALVAAWEKLIVWKRQAEDYLPLQRRLWQAASEWQKAPSQRQSKMLWDNNPRLPQVEEVLWPSHSLSSGFLERLRWLRQVFWPDRRLADDTKWLNKTELDFVQTSVKRRARSRLRVIVITTGVIIALSLALLVAETQRQTAEAQTARAENELALSQSREVAAVANNYLQSGDSETALILSTLAYAELPTTKEAEQVLRASLNDWRGIRTFSGHTDQVTGIHFSRNLKYLATASRDKTARVWDIETGEQLFVTPEHDREITGAVFSTDSSNLITGSRDGTVSIWSVPDGAPLRTIKFEDADGVRSISIHPGGEWVAIREGPRIWLYDIKSGEAAERSPYMTDERDGNRASIRVLAFTEDGKQILAGADDNLMYIWDIASGNHAALIADGVPGHASAVTSVQQSRDRRFLASLSSDRLMLWEWVDGSGFNVHQLPQSADGISFSGQLEFSPDSHFLAAGSSNGVVRIWDLLAPEQAPTQLTEQTAAITGIWFSPDSRLLSTASRDGTVRLWNLRSHVGSYLVRGQQANVSAPVFSRDGRTLATSDEDGNVFLWRVWLGGNIGYAPLASHPAAQMVIAGAEIAVAGSDGIVEFWNRDTGATRTYQIGETALKAIAVGPDHDAIALGDAAGRITLIDSQTGDIRDSWDAKVDFVTALAFVNDGAALAVAGNGPTIQIWNTTTGSLDAELSGHERDVTDLVYVDDEAMLYSASLDRTVRQWSLPSGELIATYNAGVPLLAVAAQSSGSSVAAGDTSGLIHWWSDSDDINPETVKAGSLVRDLQFGADGRLYASGENGNVEIWNLDAARRGVVLFDAHESRWAKALIVAPDGKTLYTIGDDGLVKVWLLDPAELIALSCSRSGRHMENVDWNTLFPFQIDLTTCEQSDTEGSNTLTFSGTISTNDASEESLLPVVYYFESLAGTHVAEGQTTLLRWAVENASEVYLVTGDDSEGVAGKSSRLVTVSAPTEYTLVARNRHGERSIKIPLYTNP